MKERTFGLVLVVAGILLWSLAGFFVRSTSLPLWDMVLWRSIFATLALVPLAALGYRGPGAFGGWGLLTAIVTGIGAIGYVTALTLTTVANVLVIYGTLPFLTAGLAWLVLKEAQAPRILIASTASFLGVLLVAGTSTGIDDIAGIGLAMLMTLTFAALIIMMRRAPSMNVALVNAVGIALCLPVAWPRSTGIMPDAHEPALMAGLGVLTTALSFWLFMLGSRRVAPAEAALMGLLDVVAGPLWVWLAFAEHPGQGALAGGAIVIAAIAWYLAPSLRGGISARPEPTSPSAGREVS